MPFTALKPPKTDPEESDAEAETLEMATLIDLKNKKLGGLAPLFSI